jgi:hypothetical protein
MNMFRHDYIASNQKFITAADTLQSILKKISRDRPFQVRLAPIATESHEVEVPHFLVALQAYNHDAHLI